jgi:hypothetical protein
VLAVVPVAPRAGVFACGRRSAAAAAAIVLVHDGAALRHAALVAAVLERRDGTAPPSPPCRARHVKRDDGERDSWPRRLDARSLRPGADSSRARRDGCSRRSVSRCLAARASPTRRSAREGGTARRAGSGRSRNIKITMPADLERRAPPIRRRPRACASGTATTFIASADAPRCARGDRFPASRAPGTLRCRCRAPRGDGRLSRARRPPTSAHFFLPTTRASMAPTARAGSESRPASIRGLPYRELDLTLSPSAEIAGRDRRDA